VEEYLSGRSTSRLAKQFVRHSSTENADFGSRTLVGIVEEPAVRLFTS
jgi:hypothetical protein